MNLSGIRTADLGSKRILVRVDFNVEFKDGAPRGKYKINAAKGTLDFLSEKNSKIALLSHLGRPQGEKREEFSFKKFCRGIGQVLNREIVFAGDCFGGKVKKGLSDLKNGQILMLENVRFYREEFQNNAGFAEKLADNFDVYVNEAFGVSHRLQASLVKIAEILPSFAGLNVIREVEELSRVRTSFERPSVAIIGGAKIETKIPAIKFFADSYDAVLAGGKLGLEAKEKGIVFSNNVILPKDYIGRGLDIGPQTIGLFAEYIKSAKTIIWNGPLGKFEEVEFSRGTIKTLKAIVANRIAYKIAGGGETLQVLEENGLVGDFNFVSTGGGAMLVFLIKGTLPALEALQDQK